jgi:hypothetical protein
MSGKGSRKYLNSDPCPCDDCEMLCVCEDDRLKIACDGFCKFVHRANNSGMYKRMKELNWIPCRKFYLRAMSN